jgi:magnesium transporter
MRFENAEKHLSRDVPVVPPSATAAEIRASLSLRRFQSTAAIAVCEQGRLEGLLVLEEILPARDDARAAELMDRDPPVVGPETDQEVAAWKAVQHGESTLAVVDEDRRFLGLIPPQRLLSVLLEEHHEDMARLSGFLRGSRSAQNALEEPLGRRLLHRLPWLLVGLLGAFLAADLLGSFEEDLKRNVILAFFLPGIVYLADAVGTQTETLVVRGLSVGIPVGRVAAREAVTGVLVGLGLSGLSVAFVLWRWGDPGVALVLGISLLAACSCATLVAMGLPHLFQRLGRDPAFGSGPLATVIQDLLSVAIYLVVANLALR